MSTCYRPPVTPSYEDMLRSVIKIEQSLHRKGWDAPPRLFTVHRLSNGALMFDAVSIDLHDPVPQFIAFAGEQMSEPTAWADRITDLIAATDGLCAFMVSIESWANTDITLDERAALPQGMTLADVPTSYEARDVSMVDAWGRIYHVHRPRGKKPLTDRPASVGGPTYRGLTMMMRAVAAKLPPGRADLAALNEVPLMSAEQANALVREQRKDSAG